ncbi:MAG: hypothetical protein NT062_02420 [Proteobacteria bacterium]|nr:hypothetical protein [Pseudomonadota bacterium]
MRLAILLALVACESPPKQSLVDAPVVIRPIDGPTPCFLCRRDELCVQKFSGNCQTAGAFCIARTIDCPANACSLACEAAYCGAPYQCQNRPSCGTEVKGAFTCYGP